MRPPCRAGWDADSPTLLFDLWGPLPDHVLTHQEWLEWTRLYVTYSHDGIDYVDFGAELRDGEFVSYVVAADGTKTFVTMPPASPTRIRVWTGRDPRWITDMNRQIIAVDPAYQNEAVTWGWDESDPLRGTWVDAKWLCCEVRGGGYACDKPGGCRHEFTTHERYETWRVGACSTRCPSCRESLYQIYHRPEQIDAKTL